MDEASGRPKGPLCFTDTTVAVALYPGKKLEEVVALYHDTSGDTQVQFDAAKKVYRALQEQSPKLTHFAPQSNVATRTQQGLGVVGRTL